MQNKMKNEKEKLSKMKMKNATHRNSIDMTFKFDKYVAGYLCIRSSQKLFLHEHFSIFKLILAGHW